MKGISYQTTRWFSLSLITISIYTLFYNAKNLNFWDDEVNGFYLSVLNDSKKIIDLYSQNIHEDPLLFNYLLHFWMGIFGESSLYARLLSMSFWLLTLFIAYLFIKSITQSGKFGWLGVSILCLLPYHWLYPIAARWYALSGLLVTLNFTCFYKLFLDNTKTNNTSFILRLVSSRSRLIFTSGYILSGVLLWYTNYVAPAYFLSSLLVLLFCGSSWHKLGSLFVCYIVILFLYIPWIDTFIRQLFISTGGDSVLRDLVDFALSIYVVVAGETSVPQQLYISLPALLGLITLFYLVYLRFDKLISILTYILVPFILMSLLGLVWTKYMMLFTPLVCILITLIIYLEITENRRKTVYIMVIFFGIAWTGSAINMLSGENWLASRWLDPYQEVVNKYSSKYNSSIFATNSQSVFYYRNCNHTPLVSGNNKFRSGSYKNCNTTSVKNLKRELLQHEKYRRKKYVVILGGYSSISEDRIKRIVESLQERGLNIIDKGEFGRDDMLYWKELVTSREIPDSRIYVYVMER